MARKVYESINKYDKMFDNYNYLQKLKIGRGGMYVSFEGIHFLAHQIMGNYIGANGKFYDPDTRKVLHWFKGAPLSFEIINDKARSKLSRYELLHKHPMVSYIIGAFRKVRQDLIEEHGDMKKVNDEYKKMIKAWKQHDKAYAKSERKRLRRL